MLKIDIKEKKFGENLILNNVSINIDKPGIYGVIGKNGVGKTTLFRCILGLDRYKGSSLLNEKKTDFSNCGYCAAEPYLYDELTAKEFYKFYKILLNQKEENETIFNIPDNKLIKEMSTGMKKKVYLNSIVNKHFDIYILDEPFNGLDIEANYILINYIKKLSKTSIVLIASHIIDVLYKNCEKIYMISNKNIKTYTSDFFEEIEKDFFYNSDESI